MSSIVLPKILIADDDPELLYSAEVLLKERYQVKTALTVEIAKSILLQNEIEVLILDLNFEAQEEDGIALLDFISERTLDVEVVVLSSDQVTERIVAAMKRNLVDFIPKSGRYSEKLNYAVARAFETRRLKSKKRSEHQFLTHSPKMKALLRNASRIAESPGEFSILVTGESGSGKEILVQYIARLMGKKLVAANMAAIPREMAESELLGHMKGAFTGAVSNKIGLIETAHNGIFFLDELGECSLAIQAKLLRVVEEGELTPLGENRPKKVNVRFFGATNCDLEKMVDEKTFRLDLYQRLNTFVLKIPPLRERPEDIVLYTNQFIAEFSGGRTFTITGDGMDALLSYRWPGNVRELKNTIERMMVLLDRRIIDKEAVLTYLPEDETSKENSAHHSRSEIMTILKEEEGNRTKTAARFGVNPTTLRRWMKHFGIFDYIEAKPGRRSTMKDLNQSEEVVRV